MQRPISSCSTVDQATWAIFVFGIVFNNLTASYRLAQFLHADSPDDALVNSMFGKLELLGSNLLLYLIDQRHATFTTIRPLWFPTFFQVAPYHRRPPHGGCVSGKPGRCFQDILPSRSLSMPLRAPNWLDGLPLSSRGSDGTMRFTFCESHHAKCAKSAISRGCTGSASAAARQTLYRLAQTSHPMTQIYHDLA